MRKHVLLALSMLHAATASARPDRVAVRAGEHGGYSRVVFVLPDGVLCRSMRLGDLLVLTFPRAGPVPGLQTPPSRMLSVAGGSGQAAVGLPRGVQAHVWQIDHRVIVDVFGPPQR